MTDKMGTMFECLHRVLENKNLGSVNTDTGAKFCSMGIEPSTSLLQGSPAPYNLSRQWCIDYHINKKIKK